ncbi:hypothetical protein [Campylobacter sp. US33a]|uniref:hypothetical protein n=1 Tax=Campylobacter sp. US33a TaxID=2498120 RepID=UPI0010678046|nr:hypothetical protein [Campylobacter sp. US33a]TEY00742.1 hypothetical protein ELQ16_08895 [Campylobacter sp. US33a]
MLSSFLVGCGAENGVELPEKIDKSICTNPIVVQKVIIDDIEPDLAKKLKEAKIEKLELKDVTSEFYLTTNSEKDAKLYGLKNTDMRTGDFKTCHYIIPKIKFVKSFGVYQTEDGKYIGLKGKYWEGKDKAQITEIN